MQRHEPISDTGLLLGSIFVAVSIVSIGILGDHQGPQQMAVVQSRAMLAAGETTVGTNGFNPNTQNATPKDAKNDADCKEKIPNTLGYGGTEYACNNNCEYWVKGSGVQAKFRADTKPGIIHMYEFAIFGTGSFELRKCNERGLAGSLGNISNSYRTLGYFHDSSFNMVDNLAPAAGTAATTPKIRAPINLLDDSWSKSAASGDLTAPPGVNNPVMHDYIRDSSGKIVREEIYTKANLGGTGPATIAPVPQPPVPGTVESISGSDLFWSGSREPVYQGTLTPVPPPAATVPAPTALAPTAPPIAAPQVVTINNGGAIDEVTIGEVEVQITNRGLEPETISGGNSAPASALPSTNWTGVAKCTAAAAPRPLLFLPGWNALIAGGCYLYNK